MKNKDSQKLSTKQIRYFQLDKTSKHTTETSSKPPQKLSSTSSQKVIGPKAANINESATLTKSQSKPNKVRTYDYYKVKQRSESHSHLKVHAEEANKTKNDKSEERRNHSSNRNSVNANSIKQIMQASREATEESKISNGESQIMKRKNLSIQIPNDSADTSDSSHDRSNSAVPVYSNLATGPHRSVSVQNRTTTITQFTTLDDKESNKIFNFESTKIEEQIPLKSGREIIVPNFEATKTSVKRNGVVSAYAANTHQGIVRNYNEDRVSIILNIVKPPSRSNEVWPKCSFFGIYDGHGGSK